jgi:hypothetical protein
MPQGVQMLAALSIPHLNGIVIAANGQHTPICAPEHSLHIACMPTLASGTNKRSFLLPKERLTRYAQNNRKTLLRRKGYEPGRVQEAWKSLTDGKGRCAGRPGMDHRR